ncbi:MAG TPA: GNAT family N-acetyltransferase [Acidimicrobiia bacterium]|jgi:GNAT superfamily N-acetyltransferase|nr:GNAT family N-acetyltransferase [Acidimicrobiia bacterium]
MVPDFEILTSLPADIDRLLAASREEGYNLMERLVDDWNDHSNQFSDDGEVLLGARLDDTLVAVGGLNRDPYVDVPTVGRLRHVYVHPEARGTGVGRQLVLALLERARGNFSRLRVRAGPPGAGSFYDALGFEASSEPDATHVLVI